MKIRTHENTVFALAELGLLCGAPVWAVSLSTVGPAQPIPENRDRGALSAAELTAMEIAAAGSSTLAQLAEAKGWPMPGPVAQAAGGEDEDLRKYARDTLPTIEKYLAELRRLQK